MATTITDKAGLQDMDLDLTEDYILGGNIDASGAAFTPVGSAGTEFTGTLDGAGYTITGLNMSIAGNYNGLFGYTDGATISNLTLADFDITGEDYTSSLIGYANNTVISDITVTDATIVGESWTGGVIGLEVGCTVTDCSVTGTVTSAPAIFDGYGGFAGFTSGTYTRCSANVAVTAIAEDAIGGFVGYCGSAAFSQCYALGDVSGSDEVGGFVGLIYGNNISATFTDCYSMGDVHAVLYAGGFAQEESVWGTGTVTFTNCYSTGALTTDQAVAADYLGGFAQDDSGRTTYTACFWDVGTSGVALSAGGTGKTTVAMKYIDTYPTWDIVFSASADPTSGYPFLGWQEDLLTSVWRIFGAGTPRRESEEPVKDIVTLEALRNVEMAARGKVRTDEEGNFVYKSRYARNP